MSEHLDRRHVLLGAFGLAAAAAAPRAARAQTVLDAAKRPVPVSGEVRRVFPAGPPAAILLYTLAPDLLLGWPRAVRPEEAEFLLPEVAAELKGKTDIILDTGIMSGGDIVAALLDDEATVKTLRRRDGHTWLLPQNTAYEPILGDHATLMGRVVTVLRAL